MTENSTAAHAPSFWLEQTGPPKRRPRLCGVLEVDVCIVGGGFTGLWTAYELRRADPSLEVVVLEAEHVGFGASGRNGGWVFGKLSGSADGWRQRGGPQGPRAMARAIQATVAEIGKVVVHEGIECDWKRGGTLRVAQNETQMARLRKAVAAEREDLGEDASWRVVESDELAARIAVDGALGAIFSPFCARAQPARLVLGLAEAAERAGAVIYESTPVAAISPGAASSDRGEVRARYVIRATEGYTANLPGYHRTLLPLNSAMIVTDPIGPREWSRIRWEGAETLLDGSHTYTYSQRTADGRIAIGGRGVPYRFGSRTDREGPVPQGTVNELRERLLHLFPSLRDVAVARAWHGVLGVSRDWCPTVGLDRITGIGYAGGYAGEGVAASNLAGRTLRDLVLGRDTELARLPWVGSRARDWEPEPFRFIGARSIYSLYRLADRSELARDRPSALARVADLMAGRSSAAA